MGQSSARPIARRSRGRSYLLLARVSNLPTVWTNVLAGLVAAGHPPDWLILARTAVAASLFYSGGMLLNDACDAEYDARLRPERPIPRGDVPRGEVFAGAYALMVAGELLLAPSARAMILGLVLAASIAFYDYRHKQVAAAPLVMGFCRSLVYLMAAATAGTMNRLAGIGAVIVGSYVVGLTIVARMAGPRARVRVPLLLAGISLVDAAFVLMVSRSLTLAALAAAGFPLTLFLQRFVPGD